MKKLFLSIVDSYQNSIEASYPEKSMLTNLFVENKFWGWLGLTLIAICFGGYFGSWLSNSRLICSIICISFLCVASV